MAGWMGLSDIDYTNPTVEEGRQHAFTLSYNMYVIS